MERLGPSFETPPAVALPMTTRLDLQLSCPHTLPGIVVSQPAGSPSVPRGHDHGGRLATTGAPTSRPPHR